MNVNGTLVKAFSKNVKSGQTIRSKILALLENLLVTEVIGLSNLQVEKGCNSPILGI